jgi:SAM-dependent methyltransferase
MRLDNKGKNYNDISNPKNHWCRIVMDEATKRIVSGLDYKNFNTLEISGGKWANFGFKSYKHVAYPNYDVCKDTLNEKFDLIIAEQVFEHLLFPNGAAKNIFSMLECGGYFLVTTPFLIKVHDGPFDCTRWTEIGIKYFLAESGFPLENIRTGSWGNKKCVIENFEKWVEYDKKNHSLENETEYPLVIWALAKKSINL